MRYPKLNRRHFVSVGLASAIACHPNVAFAHRQKQAQSTIEWNDRSETLEVTHRLHMHDAEQALAQLGKLDRPDLSSLKARAIMALQIGEQFTLGQLDGSGIVLNILGAEINGAHIYVYQEAKLSAQPKGIIVDNQILHDIYPDQTNHVNVELSNQINSIVFLQGDKAKKVLA